MLPFLKPKCPVDAREKAWIETRLAWLGDQLGLDRLVESRILLPTDPCISLDGSEGRARDTFAEICKRMSINAADVDLEFIPHDLMHSVAGIYEQGQSRGQIRIDDSQLGDSQSLMATLIHELSHHVLMGGGLLSPDAPDHEYVTDLLAVFLGLGIFAANSTIRETHSTVGRWHSWSVGKQGYLTAREYGYALAVSAWIRKDAIPSWRKLLRLDARSSMEKGMKYLEATDDCLARFPRIVSDSTSTATLCTYLQNQYSGIRVATLWEIHRRQINSDEVVEGVIAQLSNKDGVVRAEAALALSGIAHDHPEASAELVNTLGDHDAQVRANAALALGILHHSPESVVPTVGLLLGDPDRLVLHSAISCAAHFGTDAASLAVPLLSILHDAIVECDFSLGKTVASALLRISPQPEAMLTQHFSGEPEFLQQATELLNEQREETSNAT